MAETDDLARALDTAALRCPGLSRAQLLVRLALEGHRATEQKRDEQRRRKLDATRTHSGCLTGAYDSDYLQHRRADWPE